MYTYNTDLCILRNQRCIKHRFMYNIQPKRHTSLIYVYYVIKETFNTDPCILHNQRQVIVFEKYNYHDHTQQHRLY